MWWRRITTLDIIPYYQEIIKQQQQEINLLKANNKKYQNTLSNLDKRIAQVAYTTIREREERLNPTVYVKEKTREEKERDERISREITMESTHNFAEGLRQMYIDRDLYDRHHNLDRFCGKRP